VNEGDLGSRCEEIPMDDKPELYRPICKEIPATFSEAAIPTCCGAAKRESAKLPAFEIC